MNVKVGTDSYKFSTCPSLPWKKSDYLLGTSLKTCTTQPAYKKLPLDVTGEARVREAAFGNGGQ